MAETYYQILKKTKFDKRKSIVFLLLIDLGYVCGIVAN